MSRFFSSLSVKEKTIFAKRLAFLVKAGVPILESLRILQKQTKSGPKKKIFDRIIADVSSGQFLSTSLAKFKRTFDQFAINLIRIGEESGTLDANLNYLADEMKKKQALRRKVFGAMVYPIFIIIATLGIAGMLTIFIFPKILPIFQSLNVKLPITTRALIFTSDFLGRYGIFLLLGIVALIILVILLLRMKPVRFFVHQAMMKVPLLGALSMNYHLANTCRTLGILLKSDIRIIRAFTIAADTSSNLVYRKELKAIAEKVAKGEKMTTHMEKRPNLFPPILIQMIAVGEAAGNLEEALMYLSDMYEIEVDELTKNLTTVLEPMLMVFMGIIVGFIAVSIITPIYGITQNLTPR